MKKIKNNLTYILLGLYFIVGLFMLQTFPFMHSDESWLSGLTRTMTHEGLNSTETFFDLLPRYPHAIKSLFHLLQMTFISFLGYSLFSVRVVSLIFGCAALVAVYKITFSISRSKHFAVLSSATIAVDIQFVYASHFARQEIIIMFGLLLIYSFILKNIQTWSYKKDIATAAIVGIMIGIHPNAFIVALVAGSIYLYYLLVDKKLKLRNLWILIGTTAACAGIFVGISYLFDVQFISHYLKYGDHLGVTMTLGEKIRAIVPFYQKIWAGVSGTYYTPFVKVQMVIFAVSIITGAIYSFFDKQTLLFIFPIAAVNVGYIVIGRYSQPSVLFMFIACWMLVFYLLSRLKKYRTVLLAIMAVALLIISFVEIKPYINREYSEYLEHIKSTVPQDSVVLANLNTEYAVSYDNLRDYRNLGYLDDNQMTFADYVKSNAIEYIIYPEEMDYIYEHRPVWNIVYGNLYPYYEELNTFIKSNCELIDEFYSPYAMRIVRYSNDKDWSVKIYKVKNEH